MIVVVATDEDGVARVRDRLARLGARASRVAAPSDRRRLVLAAVPDGRAAERIAAALRAEGEPAVTRPDEGPRLDAWRRHTQPITFGERLTVCFAWSEHDRHGRSHVVELAAGAFGSGRHPSTRLVVEQLLERVTGGERVLDVGCGNGVLGLAALELGAAHVVAVDIDAAAVEATRRSAALNRVDDRLEVTSASLGDVPGAFDVVVANLGRAGLVELAPRLVERLAPGGWLAASGISPSLCDLVAGYLRPLEERERRSDGEWAVLVLTAARADDRPDGTGLTDAGRLALEPS